jgi:hypothetical protein
MATWTANVLLQKQLFIHFPKLSLTFHLNNAINDIVANVLANPSMFISTKPHFISINKIKIAGETLQFSAN